MMLSLNGTKENRDYPRVPKRDANVSLYLYSLFAFHRGGRLSSTIFTLRFTASDPITYIEILIEFKQEIKFYCA
jgi:hypothetical protein